MARERCTELCTRATTGSCRLCEALDASDAFWWCRERAIVKQWLVNGWVIVGQWYSNLRDYVRSPEGWRAIGVIVAAYVGLYAIVEARHERQMNRALFEQNRFMTLAASGSPGGLNAALAEYQPLKAKAIPKSPNVFFLWTWFQKEQVNEDALNRWAKRFFRECLKD